MTRPITIFRKLILAAVLSALWPVWAGAAAVQSYSTRALTNADGLSNSSINCIVRDSHHLMWFGTWDGLNVYNGETFTVYRPIPSDPASISNNVVRRIVEGRGGAMWIATDRGLNRYDRASRKFRHYFTPATVANITRENSFLAAADSNGDIAAWIYDMGFFVYNPATEDFDSSGGNGFPPVADILFDNGGDLWALTLDGKIYRIERNGEGGLAVQSAEQIGIPPAAALFHDALTDRFLVRYANGETVICGLMPYRIYHTLPVPAEQVTAAAFSSKQCYIGTRNGLYAYDYDTHRMSPAAENMPVISLFHDEQGILWVGTDGQGVVMLYGTRELFRTFSPRNVPQLDPAPIRAFMSDAVGDLWAGTKGGGLYRFDESGEDTRVKRRFRREDGLLSNSVYALARTSGGNEIWAGTEATGLNYFDLRRGKLETLEMPERVNLTSIYALWPENDSVLWAGTSGYGLFRLSIDRSTVPFRLAGWRQYVFDKGDPASINNNVVYALLPDGDRHLWVGTRGGGLNRLDMETGRFAHFRFSPGDPASISGNDVISLNRDNLGRLWVGTSTGLNLLTGFDGADARFERFTEDSGIANNTIHGILADDAGGVWVSTNRGISKIDGGTARITSYYYGDGLQNNEFSDGAYYRSPLTGELYFGGIGGFNRFDPSRVQRGSYVPPLYLDSFYIDNAEVSPDDWIVERHGIRRLRIPGRVETFSFLFLPMDYIDGARCDLRYRLDGYNDNWVQLGSSRRIVFSNLPAGNYTLRVECSTPDKEWAGGEYVLPIRVLPPWWVSWWAIAAYVLLGASATYAAFAVARNRVRMRHSLEISRLESRKAEEIHQAKLRFFTNIAHEFSTSLTLIYGPTERLLAMPDAGGKMRRHLRTIESNAERMQHLIQELMEFRKVETGYLSLNVEEVDIPELIRYTSDIFADAAEEKKITFACDIEPGVGMWHTDRDAVEKILFNLLSNAFKYTPADGRVELRAEIGGGNLILSVRNTGSGIRQEEQEIVFDRFTVLERVENQAAAGHETRYGIGLALCVGLAGQLGGTISLSSTPDEYTLFRVVIPGCGGEPAADEISRPLPEPRHTGQHGSPGTEKTHVPADGYRETVLVIDDNPEMLELIREILGEHYNTSVAAGGEEAFALMEELLPDLIVCDIVMPGMSGMEVVERLKSNPLTRHIPVVFLTSDFSVESRIRGAEIGVDAYMTKPFHARHLLATVRQQTERKTRMREYYESPLASMETLDGRTVHKSDKEFVMKLSKIVGEYIDNPLLSADLLSSEMRLSRMQLYRRLKEVAGDTPTEFIRRRRLEYAERLLKTTDLTVQEIMYLSGFNNKAYFYREFAKQYHQTPKEYRNSFRKES